MSDTTTETFLNIRFFTNYSTCNFKCPYCVAQKNAANKKNLVWDDQKYTKIIDNILRLPY